LDKTSETGTWHENFFAMRLNKLFVYLGLVVLLCTLSRAEDVASDDDEDDVEVDSENEQEDKARSICLSFVCFRDVATLSLFYALTFGRVKRKRKQLKLNRTHRLLSL